MRSVKSIFDMGVKQRLEEGSSFFCFVLKMFKVAENSYGTNELA